MDAYKELSSYPARQRSLDPKSHNCITNMYTPGLDYLQRQYPTETLILQVILDVLWPRN